eukprot:100729-Amphidinium_carterae.1
MANRDKQDHSRTPHRETSSSAMQQQQPQQQQQQPHEPISFENLDARMKKCEKDVSDLQDEVQATQRHTLWSLYQQVQQDRQAAATKAIVMGWPEYAPTAKYEDVAALREETIAWLVQQAKLKSAVTTQP